MNDHAEIKGVCSRCGAPVTSQQFREKLPDGTYMHKVDAEMRCITTTLVAPPLSDQPWLQPTPPPKLHDSGHQRGHIIKGICPRCNMPVMSNQPRERLPDGAYVHHLDPEQRCIVHGSEDPSFEPIQQPPHLEIRGICPRCNQPVTSMQAREKLADGTYVHASEADCTGMAVHANRQPPDLQDPIFEPAPVIEIRGICPRCNQPVTSMHAREKLADGTYVHASAADCTSMAAQANRPSHRPAPDLIVDPDPPGPRHAAPAPAPFPPQDLPPPPHDLPPPPPPPPPATPIPVASSDAPRSSLPPPELPPPPSELPPPPSELPPPPSEDPLPRPELPPPPTVAAVGAAGPRTAGQEAARGSCGGAQPLSPLSEARQQAERMLAEAKREAQGIVEAARREARRRSKEHQVLNQCPAIAPGRLTVSNEVVGDGQRGVVLEGLLQEGTRRVPVAVKVLSSGAGEEEVRAVEREVSALMYATLRCEGARVTRLFGTCLKDSSAAHLHPETRAPVRLERCPCLVMELYPSSVALELAEHPGRGLSAERVRRYLTQLAKTLAALHAGGLLHRGIKPTGLFLTARDEVVLGHFGISKVLDLQQQGATVSRAQTAASPNDCYKAPESLEAAPAQPVSAKADVWSFAACAAEMVSGRRPFAEVPEEEVRARILGGGVPAVPRGSELEPLLARCLRREARERASSAEVLEALRELGRQECVVCREPAALADAVLCGGGDAQHLLCRPCLAGYVLASPGLVGCPLVPSGDCDDEELSQAAVLQALGSEVQFEPAHQRYLNAIRLDAVEEFRREEQERLELQEEQRRRAAEDAVAQARICVAEALTLGQSVECPGCKNPKRKDDACMHMSCECGTRFCYACGQPRSRECGCDEGGIYLQDCAALAGAARRGETAAHAALVAFHLGRMARFVRVAKERLVPAEAWERLKEEEPQMLEDVLEGRSIQWEAIDAAEHPAPGSGAAPRAVARQEEAFVERWRAGTTAGQGAAPPPLTPAGAAAAAGRQEQASVPRGQGSRVAQRRRAAGRCRQS